MIAAILTVHRRFFNGNLHVFRFHVPFDNTRAGEMHSRVAFNVCGNTLINTPIAYRRRARQIGSR